MEGLENKQLRNYPYYFSNSRTEALEEALSLLLEAFEEYADKNELTEEQIVSLKQLILNSYLEKRALYFVEERLLNINEHFNKAFQFALKQSFDRDAKDNLTKFFFYNNKKRLMYNEQY